MLYTILEANNYDEKVNMTGIFLTKESAFAKMVELLRDTLTRSDIDWDVPDDAVGFEKEEDGCSVSVAEEAYSLSHDGDFNYANIVTIPGFALAADSGDGCGIGLGDTVYVVSRDRTVDSFGRVRPKSTLIIEEAVISSLSFAKDYPEEGILNWHGEATIKESSPSFHRLFKAVPICKYNAFKSEEEAVGMKAIMEKEGYKILAATDCPIRKSEFERISRRP